MECHFSSNRCLLQSSWPPRGALALRTALGMVMRAFRVMYFTTGATAACTVSAGERSSPLALERWVPVLELVRHALYPLAQRSSPVALERCTLSCNRCGHHCRRWRDVTYRLRWRDVFNDWRLCGILTKSWRNRTYRWTWKTDFTTGDGAAYTAEAGEAQLKHAGAAYIEGAGAA